MVTLVNLPRYIALLKNYSSKPMLTKWLKKEGETVEDGEGIVVVETNKASLEIPAPVAGVLFTLRKVGETVKIGDTLGMIANSQAEIEALTAQLNDYLNHQPEPSTGTSG
ncbi:MAG: lipoyl domain-containing protein [Desulfosarcinaceae bacterium]|jgi:2-oxoglutarate dehydrogenase E2 component (dihydrolipoamide succinyltransferase)